MLGKTRLEILKEPDNLWVRIISDKYFVDLMFSMYFDDNNIFCILCSLLYFQAFMKPQKSTIIGKDISSFQELPSY